MSLITFKLFTVGSCIIWLTPASVASLYKLTSSIISTRKTKTCIRPYQKQRTFMLWPDKFSRIDTKIYNFQKVWHCSHL